MKKIVFMLLLTSAICFILASCKGVITGHEYTKDEVVEVAKFLNTSKDRMEKYLSGDITLEDLNVSKERAKEAFLYIKKVRRGNGTKGDK